MFLSKILVSLLGQGVVLFKISGSPWEREYFWEEHGGETGSWAFPCLNFVTRPSCRPTTHAGLPFM